MASESKSATAKVLDFTNVKDRGQWSSKHKPAGDYAFDITKVEEAVSAEKKNEMWVFTLQLVDDKSATYAYRCLFAENQLWKLRNLCVAAGLQVPKKKVKLDPNKLVGKRIGGQLEDDEYEGKMRSVVETVFPADELTESDVDTDDVSDETVDDEDLDEAEFDEL